MPLHSITVCNTCITCLCLILLAFMMQASSVFTAHKTADVILETKQIIFKLLLSMLDVTKRRQQRIEMDRVIKE